MYYISVSNFALSTLLILNFMLTPGYWKFATVKQFKSYLGRDQTVLLDCDPSNLW